MNWNIALIHDWVVVVDGKPTLFEAGTACTLLADEGVNNTRQTVTATPDDGKTVLALGAGDYRATTPRRQ